MDMKGNEKKDSIGARLIDTVVSIFTPMLNVFAGAGVLRGFLLLAVQVGILSETSSTYVILYCAASAIFTFLPLLLAITTAKRFGANPYLAMIIIASLMMPEFEALMTEGAGQIVSFVGIPVVLVNYSGQILPAIFAIILQSYLEKFLNKHMAESLKLVLVPCISLLIMVPFTAIVIGPAGYFVATALANFAQWLLGLNGWIMGAVLGFCWNVMIILGLHWAVNTMVIIPTLNKAGKSVLLAVTSVGNFAMAGVALGFMIRTKNPKMKSYSLSALISIAISGIVEPALYGIGLKYKRPLIAGSIASALGGALMGGMGVYGYAFVFTSCVSIPSFIGPTFMWYLAGCVLCFVSGCILTIVLGFDDKIETENEETVVVSGNKEAIA